MFSSKGQLYSKYAEGLSQSELLKAQALICRQSNEDYKTQQAGGMSEYEASKDGTKINYSGTTQAMGVSKSERPAQNHQLGKFFNLISVQPLTGVENSAVSVSASFPTPASVSAATTSLLDAATNTALSVEVSSESAHKLAHAADILGTAAGILRDRAEYIHTEVAARLCTLRNSPRRQQRHEEGDEVEIVVVGEEHKRKRKQKQKPQKPQKRNHENLVSHNQERVPSYPKPCHEPTTSYW